MHWPPSARPGQARDKNAHSLRRQFRRCGEGQAGRRHGLSLQCLTVFPRTGHQMYGQGQAT
eukprot:530446-Pyramimonas_sp.AAC.1